MSMKALFRKSLFYSIFLAMKFQIKIFNLFFKSIVNDTNFTIKFISFIYSESKNKDNERILKGSYISEVPISFFINFRSFLKSFITNKQRFKHKTQNPPLFYSNFLSSKPWYHSNEASDETDLEVEKVKNQLKENIKIFKETYKNIQSESSKDSRNQNMAEGNWDVFPLYSGTGKISANCRKCPELLNYIETLPRFAYGMAYFSIMQPSTFVHGHFGPTNTRLRYHLGLDIPKEVYFRVSNNLNKWIQDDCIVLDDSYYHEVFQQSDSKRVIFLLDCWHPQLTIHEKIFITKLIRLAIIYSNHPASTRKIYK